MSSSFSFSHCILDFAVKRHFPGSDANMQQSGLRDENDRVERYVEIEAKGKVRDRARPTQVVVHA